MMIGGTQPTVAALGGGHGLAATLRAQPGVRTVKLALGKPWTQ